MKTLLKFGSLVGLLLTIIPPFLFFMKNLDLNQMKWAMGLGMVLWFVTAPFWINKSENSRGDQLSMTNDLDYLEN